MTNQLDQEWLQLIQQAKELGLSIEEVKEALILLSNDN
ncbi:anti-repressor SinI family protein [Cytobacillus oceanisediminis]|nr:anti-repressor SinI family protein [Cytobacillus oceanisediminis]UOE57287.1 anti-repressor SinI family protein [Cytobacillus oceanisediminis]